ncbi:MAG: hypothetical protein GTO12_09580 [Proteobacteria bacterium]|nr:hypothetical protein [Pseudomonadota bacterium]
MEKQEIFRKLEAAILEGNEAKARENASEAIKQQVDPLEVVEKGLSRGMAVVGDRFEKGEAYLPELVMAADIFKAAMEVLRPEMETQKKETAKAGTVLIGTVKGDVHDIGKNIVANVFETHGFSVVDVGVDIPTLTFLEEAEKVKADVIALSSLMTNSMPMQREVIEVLEQKNIRDEYFVIVGGGPVSQEWADEIGANGYGASAIEAVTLVRNLMNQKR